ncbi:MAG: hypothetical protein NUV73_01450, partial [Candidatus Daviesbacteria bacterium]|nr:hypothetical protein [Candidatus Daviesbacteria bacterium]
MKYLTVLATYSLALFFLLPVPLFAADWIPPTCTNGTFSGCTLPGEPVCNNFGDSKNGIGTVQMWGVCYNICSVGDRNVFCQANNLRPPLCASTKIDKTILNSGDSIILTSKTRNAVKVKKFMFVFFNADNIDSSTGPRIISFDGQPYTFTDEVSARAQYSKTFNFSDLSRPDTSWGGKIPQHITINGYFIDDQGNQSIADPVCNVPFTLAAAPVSINGGWSDWG